MRTNLFYAVAGLLIGILLCRVFSCTPKCPEVKPIVKVDTVYKPAKDSTDWYQPKITFIEGGNIAAAVAPVKVPKPTAVVYADTIAAKTHGFYLDWSDLSSDHLANGAPGVESVFYSDTTATKYGNVIIQDTIAFNRIQARRVLTDFTLPEITRVVTKEQPKHNELYAGFLLQGSRQSLLTGMGPSLILKTKKDKVFDIAALYSINNSLMLQAGVHYKLSFRK